MNPELQEEIEILQKQLSEIAPELEVSERAQAEKKILYDIGKKYDEAEEWVQAEEFLLKAKEKLAFYTPQHNEEAEILSNLAGIQLDQGRFAAAAAYYQEIIALPENDFKGKAYHSLAICLLNQQTAPEEVQDYIARAIQWNTQAEQHLDLGKNYHLSALVYLQQEAHPQALEHFEEALALQAHYQHFEELKRTLHNLSLFVKKAMRPQNQLTFYNNHLEQSQTNHQEALMGFWYYYRGLWYEEEQKSKEAFADFQQAKQLHDTHQVQVLQGMLHYHLGALVEEQGKHSEAISHHAEALKLLLQQKEYEKVGLIAYFLKSSLDAIQSTEEKQEIESLLSQVKQLGLAIDEEEASTASPDPSQEPDWVSNEALAENLAAVAQLHQLTKQELEEKTEELKKDLPEQLTAYSETALELAERYQLEYQGAWFNKKKKQQKFEQFCSETLTILDNLAKNNPLDAKQITHIEETKNALNEL